MRQLCISQCMLAVILLYSCGAVETTEKTPDLLTMLETVKSGGDVSKFFSFLNEMKVAREGLSFFENISPLMKSVLGKAGKRNPRLQILLQVITGHMPDIHDIYQFITTKSGNIADDIHYAEKENPMFQEMARLIHSQKGNPTRQGMTQLAESIFGKTFNFKEDTLQKIIKGKFDEVTAEELPEFNLLEMMLTFVDNYDRPPLFKIATKGQSGFSGMKSWLGKMDTTHLARIRALPKVLQDGKYQVGKHGELPQDPDVSRYISDVASGRNLKTDDPDYERKVEALLLDEMTTLLHMVTKIVQQTAFISQVSTTPSNPHVFG